MDLKTTSRRLRQSRHLSSKARLRNLWHELARMSDRKLIKAFEGAVPTKVETKLLPYTGEPSSTRLSSAGDVLQVDYFRPNGIHLLSDQRDVKKRGKLGGRRMVLFSRKGDPVSQWTRARDFYFAWLDHVMGTEPAFLINDSRFIGNFLYSYQRPNVTTAQILHECHLRPDYNRLSGFLTGEIFDTVRNLPSYDLVVTLMARQVDDFRTASFHTENVVPIPNSRKLPEHAPDHQRDPNTGVMLSRLVDVKRVDHAIAAVALLKSAGSKARLKIYGDGELENDLQNQIDTTGCAASVSLMGYSDRAIEQFETASFSVLSSKSEGMGLVLIESMGYGCIPIAYDIRYGPSDIITHGENGFLVPPGDVQALADTIANVSALDSQSLSELRKNARKRAAEFESDAITKIWGKALTEARDRKRRSRTSLDFTASLEDVSFKEDYLLFQGTIQGYQSMHYPSVFLSWTARGKPVFGRISVSPIESVLPDSPFEIQWPLERAQYITGDVLDFHIEIEDSGGFARKRLAAPENVELPFQSMLEPYKTKKGHFSIKFG
ncbi:glycosyltransferase [Haloglycomyces albus]|uniref:glycosyltransferase n=1 Tax=Haloglycomyces albus TaxID=526067 RepID=UPI00146FBADC|nr:glycosyltransferase [Haloglycomyces albus]